MAMERRHIGRPAQSGGSLVDLIDRILDKGLVIDAWARVSLVGIELLTIEARIVVASVNTYLTYAEAIGQMPLVSPPQSLEASSTPALPRPTDDQILGYLDNHPEGVQQAQLEAHFEQPRADIQDIMSRLTADHRASWDMQRGLYFPA